MTWFATPTQSSGGADAPSQGVSATQWALIILGALTLFRLWYITCVDLVPDEAYYWLWSKRLAASYRDKGPGIAWAIALSTRLFGDTVFGIRALGVLINAGTAFQLFRLGQRLYDDRTGLWCVIVAAVIPMFAVGAILMTIDTLSVFFWAWAANLFWSGLDEGRTRYWLLLGLAVGLGFLAKFTNGVQLACFGLFLCWSRPHRHFLVSRQSLVVVIAFGVCLLPILWWNIQTGWIHASALHSRSGVEGSFGIHPKELFRFLGEQLGVVSPPILIGMAAGAIGLWRYHGEETRVKYLLTQFVPLQALFIFFSLNKAGMSNWIAPSLIAGVVLLVAFWREGIRLKPRWRGPVWFSLAATLLITGTLHSFPFLRVPRQFDLLRRAEGWTDFAQHVEKMRAEHHPDILIGNSYQLASMLQFYLPDRPPTYMPPAPYGSSQFTLWPGYEVKAGTRAMLVTDSTGPLPKSLQAQFTSWNLVDDFWSEHHGRPTTQFRIYMLGKD